MTTSVTRPCFTTQHQTYKTTAYKIKTDFFWSQTGLVLRPTVPDHITGKMFTEDSRGKGHYSWLICVKNLSAANGGTTGPEDRAIEPQRAA